jgi:hypothetical protein
LKALLFRFLQYSRDNVDEPSGGGGCLLRLLDRNL